MIKDIENGLINCVITKDLSRLGRNYLDCGLYLEVFFPEHNVRYIAVKSRLLLHDQFKRPLLALCEIHSGCASFPAGIKKRRYFLPKRG